MFKAIGATISAPLTAQITHTTGRSRTPVPLRTGSSVAGDPCALPQENKDGALGEDKEGTSPSVLSDLPA